MPALQKPRQKMMADIEEAFKAVGWDAPVPLGHLARFDGGVGLNGHVIGPIVGFELEDSLIIHISAKFFRMHQVRWIRIPLKMSFSFPGQGPFRSPQTGNLASNAAIYLTTLEGRSSWYHSGWLSIAEENEPALSWFSPD